MNIGLQTDLLRQEVMSVCDLHAWDHSLSLVLYSLQSPFPDVVSSDPSVQLGIEEDQNTRVDPHLKIPRSLSLLAPGANRCQVRLQERWREAYRTKGQRDWSSKQMNP